jgi:hypothetical protein
MARRVRGSVEVGLVDAWCQADCASPAGAAVGAAMLTLTFAARRLQPAMTSASQPTQFVLIHPQKRPGYFTEFRMNELLISPTYSERIERLSAIQR